MTGRSAPSVAPLVVLAAGGTGGHVFPAEALAGELVARGARLALFTDDRGRRWGGALADHPVVPVRGGSPAAGGALRRAGNVLSLGAGAAQAYAALRRFVPAVVVGFGGYASVPTMVAAWFRGVPSVIHEQNAVLGRANRLVAGGAYLIATSFPDVRHLATNDARVRLVGNPVRDAVGAVRDIPYVAPAAEGPLRVLVVGGSQGAASFGTVVPEAIAALPASLLRRLRVEQQCRPEDVERVRAFYRDRAVDAGCATFFDDIPARLAAAHLVIGRAGASTVAELTTAGRPAILVPFPHATEDHQRANAKALDAAGGAILLPHERFTSGALRLHLEALLGDPARLAAMAGAARGQGRPDAAARLADLVCELAGLSSASILAPRGAAA